jgi:hypothetical protein
MKYGYVDNETHFFYKDYIQGRLLVLPLSVFSPLSLLCSLDNVSDDLVPLEIFVHTGGVGAGECKQRFWAHKLKRRDIRDLDLLQS